jgi:Leucine-rich repeat (LRR) protein
LTGTIDAQGEFKEGETQKAFRVSGRFRCMLKDSAYDFQDYQTDWIRILKAKELEKLMMASLSNPDSVEEVELGGFELTEIPVEIKRFKRLRKLMLAKNQIVKLDVALLADLDSLKELDISGNPITEISDDIKDLRTLTNLNVSGCKLKSVPKGLFELVELKTLDLSATQLSMIPEEIKHLERLEVLDLTYSDIWAVPNEIFELPNLNSLALPDSVRLFKLQGKNLRGLISLDVPYELIEFNNAGLQKLQNLRDLSISFRYKTTRKKRENTAKELSLSNKRCLRWTFLKQP